MDTAEANKEIAVNEVIAKLVHFAKLYGITHLFAVGGFAREFYAGKIWRINDIDVASAFEDEAMQLGGLFASEELKALPKIYHRSGAAMVLYQSKFGNIKVEFQGNSVNPYMHNQEVRIWMHKNNIEDIPLMNNIYGRDFTINAMVFSLHNERLYDPTKRAADDMKRKRIISLLPAKMLIKYNPLAVLRAIRFALTYDFHIDPALRIEMKTGYDKLVKSLSQERIIKEVVRILKIKPVEGLEMLKKYNLDRLLLNPEIEQYLGDKNEDTTNR
ncbi:hypothetical protein LCGC14_1080630 [marine sediment metagenome]|uniref:Poly A polymerase head domain-containing protein n=1 Tax=marine sediment metagenome TaxID=412755 RepID=A0A0F9MK46_9ZZZZ